MPDNTSAFPPALRAATKEGIMLPVIDVTNPRFTVPDDPANVDALINASIREEIKRRGVPRFIMRFMIRSIARRSLLARALFRPDATFLAGMSTYVMKLGAENLVPPFDSPTDKRFAASSHLTLLRLRTQQTARLLADGLAIDLLDTANRPLHLINIAGGPAIDSLNALILLRRQQPALLQRPITIHVFDGDDAGPYFGANALAALKAEGQALAGLDITFDARPYDWNDTGPLHTLIDELAASNPVIAASSEGGLFEYGDDDAIVANLKVLRAGGARLVAGSVTRDDESRRRIIANSSFKLVPRGLQGFEPLAQRGGFAIARSEPGHLSDQVALRPL